MATKLIVTDLDNTLWDWFHVWYASFSAMLTKLEDLTGLPAEDLEPEMRMVHQRVGTTEYTFVLDEMPCLVERAWPRRPSEVFAEALAVRARVRRAETRLYDGVFDTLRRLSSAGVRVVAFTESNAYWTEWRIRKTGLDGLINVLFSAPDQGFPEGMSRDELRTNEPSSYGLKDTEHRTTPPGYLKPDPTILTSILDDCGIAPSDALFVGDSLIKDIGMANGVGVPSAHAAYGVAVAKPEYELLRRVTHWSDADVERERVLGAANAPHPTYVLAEYSDLLGVCGV